VILHRRRDPTARLESLRALPAVPESAPALVEAALDPSPDVATAALRRLEALGGPAEAAELRSRLLALDLAVVPACARTLRILGDRGAVEVARAGLRDGSPTVRAAAAIALRELRDESAGSALRAALGDERAEVRRTALDALAALDPDPAAEEACARLLDDPDPGVRVACVRAVSLLAADPEARLRPILRDPSASVRRELARRSGPLGAEAVAALLRDEDPDVRAEAAWTLTRSPRGELVPQLIAVLDDPRWHVRRAACRALGTAGDGRARAGLVRTLLDPQATVREAAKRALSEIFRDRLWQVLADEIPEVDAPLRCALVHVLGATGDRRAAGPVAGLAGDPSPHVRVAVVHALPGLLPDGYESVLEPLVRDVDSDVRHAAATVLGREQVVRG
jgi:HEAT repeat protein